MSLAVQLSLGRPHIVTLMLVASRLSRVSALFLQCLRRTQFSWRNGWFWNISQREVAAGRSDPFPYHSQLLKDVGAV
jgi:hypothetical protein